MFPTWIAVREHLPVEKDLASDNDLESNVGTAAIVDSTEREKFAVGKTAIGRDAAL